MSGVSGSIWVVASEGVGARYLAALAARRLPAVALPWGESGPPGVELPDGSLLRGHAPDLVLITSRHAVAHLAPDAGEGLEAACVGVATAEAARGRGFSVALVGRAGAAALARAILAERPRARRVLFLCGREARPEGPALLEAGGVAVTSLVTYAMRPRSSFPADVEASPAPRAILLGSPRAADALHAALRACGRTDAAQARWFALGETTAAHVAALTGRRPHVVPPGEAAAFAAVVDAAAPESEETTMPTPQAPPWDDVPGPRSRAYNRITAGLFPGGVSSPVRAFRGVGGEPPVVRKAEGAYLVDVDGRAYVDLVGSWGPMILGHAHPEVVRAVQARLRRGLGTGTPSPDEARLGRLVTRLLPTVEKLRFVVSGTEACMGALRLARAATARDKVLKFQGCYHGHADAFLSSAGSGALTFGTPDSPGVPADVAKDTLTVPYNDLAAARRALAENPGQVAAVFVEPVAGNMGLVLPEPGFLEGLRALCTEHGALLVFDEVMTGFRVHLGGAQARFAVAPDLTCFGKVIGGGLPVGAYGGRADLLEQVAPQGPVYQAGTLAGNPIAMTAGHATLRALARPGVFARIEQATAALAAGLEREARAAGIPARALSLGAMLGLWFGDRAPRNLAEAQACDLERFRRYHRAMLARGVHLPPSPFEAWFVSLAHDAPVIERILDAHRGALETLHAAP